MPEFEGERVDEDISVHVFSVSAGLLGVCLTVIGIIRLVIATRGITTFADDLLALDAAVFLASCCLAYASLRAHKNKHRATATERLADVAFISGLALMAIVCVVITYALF